MVKTMAVSLLTATVLALTVTGCGKKKDDEGTATVGAKMRTTGTTSGLALGALMKSADTPAIKELLVAGSLTANSQFNLESFKVPIFRVNLVTGLSGTGYSGTSPNFYTCPGSTAADCYVDLASATTVDNLLKTGGDGSVSVDDDKTYEGAALEFCGDNAGGTFNMLVKGSAELGGVTYYTNAASALSTTGPSEEVAISAACGGQTTYLQTPVVLGPDKTVSLVLYVEPAGAVLLADNKNLVNSNCSGTDSLAICASRPSVMVTVSDAAPTVERYVLEVQGADGSTPWADMLLTLIFASDGSPVGATAQQIYTNTVQARLMHTLQVTFSSVQVVGDTYNLGYGGTTGSSWISGFKRETGGTYSVSSLVDTTVEVIPRKL